jgi:hypothetical protein
VGLLFQVAVAVVLFAVVLRVGLWGLRLIAHPASPPEPGELRKLNVRYRCPVCGMEMRVLLAPNEKPDPPRHCMEEMEVTAAPYE